MEQKPEVVSSETWTTIGQARDGDVRLVLQIRKEISLKPAARDRVEYHLHGAIDEYVMEMVHERLIPCTTEIVLETEAHSRSQPRTPPDVLAASRSTKSSR